MIFWQLLYQGIPQQPCPTYQPLFLGTAKLYVINCIMTVLSGAIPYLSSSHVNLESSLNIPPYCREKKKQEQKQKNKTKQKKNSSFEGTARGNLILEVQLLQLTKTSLIIEDAACFQTFIPLCLPSPQICSSACLIKYMGRICSTNSHSTALKVGLLKI